MIVAWYTFEGSSNNYQEPKSKSHETISKTNIFITI